MAQINQFQIVSNGVYLDAYDNLDFSFTYQIEDIEDITQKKTSFSKTILLPGTKINQEYFKQIQDIDIDISNSTYNPKKSLPVQVLVGDELIFAGNLQLLQIITNQKQVDFEVVITGVFKNIMINFSDYYLNQLNIDEYNHPRNITTITDSYNNNIYVNGILTQVEPGTGYIYPMVMNGNFQPTITGPLGVIVNSYDLNPAIYLKTLVDKLFDFAGYTYTSKFFNSDYFKSLIVPLDSPQYTSEEYNNRITRVGLLKNEAYTYPPSPIYPQSFKSYFQSYFLGSQGTQPISPAMNRTNTNFWTNATSGRYWFPLKRETGTENNITFQDPGNQWSTNQFGNSSCLYINQEPGMYAITLKAAFNSVFIHKNGEAFRYKSGQLLYWVYLKKRDAATGAVSIISQSNNGSATSFSPSSSAWQTGSYYDTVPVSMNLNASNVYLNTGDRVFIEVKFSYPQSVLFDITNTPDIYFQAVLPWQNTQLNYLEIKPATTTNYSINAPLPLSTMLPNIKMRELFLDVCKMFNLMVYDDVNVANNLIIEPKDDFFNSKMKVKDWTYKLDYNQDVIQIPMSELDVKSYVFTYKQDGDYYNKQFKELTGKVYGEYRADFINDFSTTDKKLELFTSPTPVSDNFIKPSGLISPFFCDIDDNNSLKPIRPNTRILFSKKINNSNYSLRNYPTSSVSLQTSYIFAGMYDNPTNPTYTLEFGNSGVLYYSTQLCCPTNTLINQFYSTTINELNDVNSKLLEAYFHLTPSDINDFDFRDVILINNSYWRVNTIVDYNPNAIDKTTKVILYKLNYLDVAYNDNLDVSESEVDCPDDMVAKPAKNGGYIYVSLSNQPITEACCENIGGVWSNGVCKALITPNTPVPAGGSTSPNFTTPGKVLPQTQIKSGGVFNERPNDLLKNQTINNSNTIIMAGVNNYVDYGVSNAIIVGNNNSITDGTTNSIIVGDGITNAPSNSIVVGDLLIDTDGLRWLNPYIVDGMEDKVMDTGKTNLIDLLDAGEDSVRPFGGDSKQRPIIDGTIPPSV